jgi:uncharacterized protein YjbJ (UPF0337 family)
MKPNKDEIKGEIDRTIGAAKEHIGQVTGDPFLESEGSDQRAAGEAQKTVGNAKRKVGEFVQGVGEKIADKINNKA